MAMLSLLVLLFGSATSVPHAHPDKVIYLPGAPAQPVFPLFSGFLHATEGSARHNIFYVLAEAIRVDPSDAPLIVWLNGGPGESSLIGLLTEHGPFLINSNTGQLRYNDFSWNQYANVLYIESPIGVGFSYSSNNLTQFIDDGSTARLNRKALEDFMTRVHPQYATRDFYLTGESYGGAYIPHLAREILNKTVNGEFTNPNFKGIAMGNAAIDDFSNRIAASIQLYGMGIIPEKEGVNLFDLWKETLSREAGVEPQGFRESYYLVSQLPLGGSAPYYLPVEANQAEDHKQWHIAKPVMNVECHWRNLTEIYLNREEVQQALHSRTKERPTIKWLHDNKQLRANFTQDVDTIPVYKDIINKAQEGFRILFYTGDMDLVCPPLQVAFGARRIAEQNEMKIVASSPNWRYLGDFGGARTSYQSKHGRVNMDVITVRGSGHSAPRTQPDRAFQIINNFITAETSKPVDYSKKIRRR